MNSVGSLNWIRERIEMKGTNKKRADYQVPRKCPICKEKLLLKGKGWGFCDNCACEIEIEDK